MSPSRRQGQVGCCNNQLGNVQISYDALMLRAEVVQTVRVPSYGEGGLAKSSYKLIVTKKA